MLALSQLSKSMRRLVTTATGTIGRPDNCASVTMPWPQTRAIFGMSAVITTISPSLSARSIAAQRLDAALLADIAAAGARAADGADAEMPQGDGVELSVARAGDEACRPVLRPLGEMDHEMLPVPHGGDHGHLDPVIGIRRFHDEPVRALHELQVTRDEKAEGFLNRRASG